MVSNILSKITKLLIEPTTPQTLEDSTNIDLNIFSSLSRLELDYIKPNLLNVQEEFRNKIVSLKVSNALNSLSELLNHNNNSSENWSELVSLRCPQNNIPEIDESITLLPKLTTL